MPTIRRSSGSALDRDVNLGGIDALTRGLRARTSVLERLRDLLVPVLESAQAGSSLDGRAPWISQGQLGLEVGYSTTVRYLHGWAIISGGGPGRNAKMKSNAMLS